MVAFFTPAPIPAVSRSFSVLGTNQSVTNVTTYTFSSMSFGAAAPSREIFVVAGALANASRTISSITVGGQNCTFTSIGNLSKALVAWVPLPTGTSGDVVLTFSGAMLSCYIQLYRVVRLSVNSGIVDSDEQNNTLAGDATQLEMTAQVPAGGFALSSLIHTNGNGAIDVGDDFTADHGQAFSTTAYWRASHLTSPFTTTTENKTANFNWDFMAGDGYFGGVWTFKG